MTAPRLFDPNRLVQRRARSLGDFSKHRFLYDRIVEDLLERLADVKRTFAAALIIGAADEGIANNLRALGMTVQQADPCPMVASCTGGAVWSEDISLLPDGAVDLVVVIGVLESVNDLPGALISLRRMLRPDGLMLCAFAGAGTLPHLRAALLAGDEDRPAQRLHPQVEVRALGDLLSRAGFAMPVADCEKVAVRYGSLFPLLTDLRGMGAAQCLASAPPSLTRAMLARAAEKFAQGADADGRVTETFVILHGSGWAPSPDQPKPAKRGSATTSLAAALKAKA
jgi:NADH dehydrogenase [ubiquinone] 1 alpha subcomplex assembly factor 5